MPFLVSRLSGGRGAKATNIKLLLPPSARSLSILRRRLSPPFVLPLQRSEAFTLQRLDLKGSRVKPQRQQEPRECIVGAPFHRGPESGSLWKHDTRELRAMT